MRDADPFDPDRWQTNGEPIQTPAPTAKQRRPPRCRSRDRFLKGPIPWPWLQRAMVLPGKALAVGLMLWLQRGLTGRRTVLFCLTRAAADGIPTTTARRAIRELAAAGLVTIQRRPGRGLEVTLNDPPPSEPGTATKRTRRFGLKCIEAAEVTSPADGRSRNGP
jgi:hypothetical protein